MRTVNNSRRLQIANYVKQMREASVKELSEYFAVSPLTIRRDLIALEEQQILLRYHGGARALEHLEETDENSNNVFERKRVSLMEEKRRIAEKACEYLSSDDIIFMNSGSTVLFFLEAIKDKHVTVVTNNAMAPFCEKQVCVELLSLGGNYMERAKSFVGEITVNTINGIYSNCAVLGVNALDPERGMTTWNYQECGVNDAMINHTRGKVILLADHTKIGKVTNYVSSSLDKIDLIITDDGCDPKYVSVFKEKGVDVIVV